MPTSHDDFKASTFHIIGYVAVSILGLALVPMVTAVISLFDRLSIVEIRQADVRATLVSRRDIDEKINIQVYQLAAKHEQLDEIIDRLNVRLDNLEREMAMIRDNGRIELDRSRSPYVPQRRND
jgi:hypothetical protein